MLAEELVVIETDEAFVVAYASDPADWIARFEKCAGFPARAWAERMAQRHFILETPQSGTANQLCLKRGMTTSTKSWTPSL